MTASQQIKARLRISGPLARMLPQRLSYEQTAAELGITVGEVRRDESTSLFRIYSELTAYWEALQVERAA